MPHRSVSFLITAVGIPMMFGMYECRPTPSQTAPTNTAAPAPAVTVSDQKMMVSKISPTPTTTSTEAVACAAEMREIAGTYCAEVEHLCLAGYPGIGSPWTVYPGGAKNIEYCESYVVGHALCKGSQQPLRFCIDRYEYTDSTVQKPRVNVTWYEASKFCAARGKRLCNDNEWTLACEGPDRLPYPYGWKRDANACNIERTHRSDIELPGTRPRCVSPFGVYDMTGNVDEWTRNVTLTHAPYISLLKGGHMLGKVRNRCRPATTAHSPGFASDVQSFRCCSAVQ